VSTVYVFEGSVVKSSENYYIYIPRRELRKLRKLHGRKVKVIVIDEGE
jgi:hypothetical protein